MRSPETSGEDHHLAEDDEWPIEAPVMGDGSCNANGCTLQEGVVHASAKRGAGMKVITLLTGTSRSSPAPGTRHSNCQNTRSRSVVTAVQFRSA